MTDEIKDLLQYLKNVYESEETSTWLNKLQIKDLLDYITNLQEENERLNKQYDLMEQSLDEKQEVIDKAIEYIKSNPNVFYDEYLLDVETIKNSETTDKYVGEIKFISNLLNILQGSDKE